MPWVEEEDGADEEENVSRGHGHDEGAEEWIREERGEGDAAVVLDLCFDAFDCDEDRGEEEVSVFMLATALIRRCRWENLRHENCPEVDLCHVKLVTALRPITQREDETRH